MTPLSHTVRSLSKAGRADDEPDDYDDFDNNDCWNCGGEGFVSSCFEEYACLYPDEGCDLCTRRCDVCRPRPAQSSPSMEKQP